MTCNHDDLVAFVQGNLSAAQAADVEAHAAGCPRCRANLEWLRAERRFFRRRATVHESPLPEMWAAIRHRMVPAPRRPWLGRTAIAIGAAAALAAGLALMVSLHTHEGSPTAPVAVPVRPASSPRPPMKKSTADQAVSAAVTQYATAVAVMETAYAARRPSLGADRARRFDARFARMRRVVDDTRHIAGPDVEGGRRVIKAYAAYLRVLRTALIEEDLI